MPHKRDHPRVCGEKRFHLAHGLSVPGSPPRMRGKVELRYCNLAAGGITPAYAGKSVSWYLVWSHIQDHPRVCGEKQHVVVTRVLGMGSPPRMRGKGIFATLARRVSGSPPRMRGKASTMDCSRCSMGITPAYAGKSTKQEKHRDKARDHPRVCGEKYLPDTL